MFKTLNEINMYLHDDDEEGILVAASEGLGARRSRSLCQVLAQPYNNIIKINTLNAGRWGTKVEITYQTTQHSPSHPLDGKST